MSGQLRVPAALPPRKKPGRHYIGDWVDPKAGLDVSENRNLSYRDSNPGSSGPYPSRYTD